MTNDILVSIIIPTYNRASLLEEAIQSCYEQTYRPIECIIVDDGSTDDTKIMVEEIAKSVDDRFTLSYIYQQNAGSQVARNTGTKASTGEFIQYLDSDDLLYPEKIEKQVKFLKENEGCDGVFGKWEMGNLNQKEVIEAWDSDDMITQLLVEKGIVVFSFLMRKRIVEKIGDWDINIKRNQEIDFQLRGVLKGGNFKYQNFICGLWRIHEEERIANSTGPMEFLSFYNKWEHKLNEQGLFNKQMKSQISKTYLWLANNNKNDRDVCYKLLEEAVRLYPEIPFVNTWKMRILKTLFGLNYSLKLWFKRASIN